MEPRKPQALAGGVLKTRRRLVLAAMVGAALLMALPVGALAAFGFVDVPADHTHADGIQFVSETGISVGYDDDTFRPANNVTRGQMATFLRRSAGKLVAAGAYIGADGTVIDWFNHINGVEPVVAKAATGSYIIDVGFNPGDAMFQVTVDHNDSVSSFGTAGVYPESDDNNDIVVDIYDAGVGALGDAAFYVQVYGE